MHHLNSDFSSANELNACTFIIASCRKLIKLLIKRLEAVLNGIKGYRVRKTGNSRNSPFVFMCWKLTVMGKSTEKEVQSAEKERTFVFLEMMKSRNCRC